MPFKKKETQMNKIQDIEDRIIKLKQLKLDVEIKLARELYKKIENTLGEDFSFQLAAILIEENWNNASAEKKEQWRSKARTFPIPKTSISSPKS